MNISDRFDSLAVACELEAVKMAVKDNMLLRFRGEELLAAAETLRDYSRSFKTILPVEE